jgi:hypothetical protein
MLYTPNVWAQTYSTQEKHLALRVFTTLKHNNFTKSVHYVVILTQRTICISIAQPTAYILFKYMLGSHTRFVA